MSAILQGVLSFLGSICLDFHHKWILYAKTSAHPARKAFGFVLVSGLSFISHRPAILLVPKSACYYAGSECLSKWLKPHVSLMFNDLAG